MDCMGDISPITKTTSHALHLKTVSTLAQIRVLTVIQEPAHAEVSENIGFFLSWPILPLTNITQSLLL